ncbi:NAD(P)-binding protein [Penicillium brevicompactum]
MYPIGKLLNVAGSIALGILSYNTWRFISFHLALYGDRKLDRYKSKNQRSWAIVTGASAGIGLGYAEELITRGFGVIIFGHKLDELQQAEIHLRTISDNSDIRIVKLDAITASPTEIKDALNEFKQLHITILINNVGGAVSWPFYKPSREHTADEVDNTINLNARAVKGFIASFSRAISREMKATGVAINSIVVYPGDVHSQANTSGLAPFSPSSREYAKMALDRVVTAVRQGRNEMSPFWMHGISGVLDFVPEFLVQSLTQTSLEGKLEAQAEQMMKVKEL